MHHLAQTNTQKLVAELWRRSLPQVLERLDLLNQAAEAASHGSLPVALRAEAASIAHKFSGSLGMFGFSDATTLARELEHELETPAPQAHLLAELTTRLRGSLFPTL